MIDEFISDSGNSGSESLDEVLNEPSVTGHCWFEVGRTDNSDANNDVDGAHGAIKSTLYGDKRVDIFL
jgi:hypothetical protein